MKVKGFQCLFCIFVVGFAVFSGFVQSKETAKAVSVLVEPDEESAFQNVLYSCVRLQGNGHYGSGNIYRITEEQMIIVSNRHVLQYFDRNGFVTFYDGKEATGEVLLLSEEYDIGFLAVKKADFTKEELAAYVSVAGTVENYNDLEKNDSIFMADIATDITNPKKYSGEVTDNRKYLEDYGQEMFYGDAYAREGMSGCGVFDDCGNYLAVLSGGTEYNEIAAVPLDIVEKEYKKIKK